MFEDFIKKTKEWAINEPFVEAIILVGSYARGTQKVDSDIDLVILTSNKQYYIDNTQILSAFGLIDRSNIEFYGECTSIRIWYKNGLEVEFGMVPLTWINEIFAQNPKLIRLGLSTWSGNERMMQLAEKLGLKKEAVYRKARIVGNKYYDSVSYGLLKEEWYNLVK